MLTTNAAIDSFQLELKQLVQSFGICDGGFGRVELVQKAAEEAAAFCQKYARAQPSKADAYAAALAFMRDEELDLRQRDLIASALAEPLKELSGSPCALGSTRLQGLLDEYRADAERGDLWRLTWYGLFSSYFSFDPVRSNKQAHEGQQRLREMLCATWPCVDAANVGKFVPDWVKALRMEAELLGEEPSEKYASQWLRAETESVARLASDLGISQSSWLWHQLVLAAVRHACKGTDSGFSALIPRLIHLLDERPAYRDEAIEHILIRYHGCKSSPPHDQLRDYVVSPTAWKNPKLRSAGIATAWNRVPDAVWQMVLGWVNKRNLQDFFDILAARNAADEGRLAFWSRYMDQIVWTRLVFGSDTLQLKSRNPKIRELIAREEGAYAELTSNTDVDAFMMQIGDVTIVEFSKQPNAAYVYATTKIKFNLNAASYLGSRDDLKYGFYGDAALRIRHVPGWETSAAQGLRQLGILPDAARRTKAGTKESTPSSSTYTEQLPRQSGGSKAPNTARAASEPQGALFTMRELESLVKRVGGARIVDSRAKNGGRLWVYDPSQDALLARTLESYGFRWATSRSQWYYPGS